MPTYEYRCTECGKTFETVQKFTDDPIETCPSCGGRVKKLFGNVGIVFKGNGFYKTDSRASTSAVSPGSDRSDKSGGSSNDGDSSGSGSGNSDTPSKGTPDSGGSSTADSKPAAPADKPAAAAATSSSSGGSSTPTK